MSNTIIVGDSSNGSASTSSGVNLDANGRKKVVNDKSLFNSVFTFNVPVELWKEEFNDNELPAYSNAQSIDGHLSLVAGNNLNDTTVLSSYRHPRYEPNRGLLYSTSCFLPNPTSNGIRDFGVFTNQSGFFFRLRSTGLFACRIDNSSGLFTIIEEVITVSENIDLEKGNTYDIQID